MMCIRFNLHSEALIYPAPPLPRRRQTPCMRRRTEGGPQEDRMNGFLNRLKDQEVHHLCSHNNTRSNSPFHPFPSLPHLLVARFLLALLQRPCQLIIIIIHHRRRRQSPPPRPPPRPPPSPTPPAPPHHLPKKLPRPELFAFPHRPWSPVSRSSSYAHYSPASSPLVASASSPQAAQPPPPPPPPPPHHHHRRRRRSRRCRLRRRCWRGGRARARRTWPPAPSPRTPARALESEKRRKSTQL